MTFSPTKLFSLEIAFTFCSFFNILVAPKILLCPYTLKKSQKLSTYYMGMKYFALVENFAKVLHKIMAKLKLSDL
jgi:hypothetical protein